MARTGSKLTIGASVCILALLSVAVIVIAVSTWKAAADEGIELFLCAERCVCVDVDFNHHGRHWTESSQGKRRNCHQGG